MNYHQLTATDRGAIEILLKEHYTQEEIARKLGVNPSTVSREVSGRSTPSGYLAKSAQIDYDRQRKKCRRKRKLNYSPRQKYITSKLQLGWSPQQISGRLKTTGQDDLYVCPETIYQCLYEDDWAKQEHLTEYLRYGRKRRRKQKGRSVHKTKIPNRVSIHDRPKKIKRRTEYGHAEGDSVVYPKKYAINTMNELFTGLLRFTKLERRTATLTAKAMKRRALELGLKTVTLDNGLEFAKHETIGIPTYFADPYCSCQRGANENGNGLLRGYLPKRYDITNLTQEELDDIAEELNDRPRKRLNYKTPNEVYSLLQKGVRPRVALTIRI